jgi:hypothetical protein
MPFRTRDFAVFLLLVAFLMVGITSTIHSDFASTKSSQTASLLEAQSDEEVVYEVVTTEDAVDTRKERLKTLRDKIAALILTDPEPEIVSVSEEESTEATTPETLGAVDLCASYAPSYPAWSPTEVAFEVVEGARLVYRPLVPLVTINELGEEISSPDKEVLLQLPLRSFPVNDKICIGTDVIGIALDGSLIRNSDYTAYKIFGSDTRIGYALDGFAIHGTAGAEINVDACGGATVAGEYRYFLNESREGMLGCFSGAPITL